MTYSEMMHTTPTTGQFIFVAAVQWFDDEAGVAQERRFRTMRRAMEFCADLRVQGINAIVIER